jgi:glutamine cyclotransferase
MVVTLNGVPQSNLNELEWVNGYIYANQWQTSNVLKISPQSGEVVEVLDLKFLNKEIPKEYHRKIDVLNGIAYDESSKTLWLTGKYWPYYFQISP